MGFVADEVEVFVGDGEEAVEAAEFVFRIVDLQLGERERIALQELLNLVKVVFVDVVVAEGVDEFAGLELSHVCDQMCQECV